MSDKVKTFRSFHDMPLARYPTEPPAPKATPFVNWDVGAMTVKIIGQATETLQSWLTARLMLLLREKVAMEDISIVNRGGRTIIRVLGTDRYEFKIKCQMEER